MTIRDHAPSVGPAWRTLKELQVCLKLMRQWALAGLSDREISFRIAKRWPKPLKPLKPAWVAPAPRKPV